MEKRTAVKARSRWFGQRITLLMLLLITVGSAWGASGDNLLHNSTNLGTKYWSGYGGWGVSGGKYKQFTCSTCHNKTTQNVKRVAQSIPTFIGISTLTPKPVIFNNITGFGNDAGGHATSKRICEVCHTQTTVHRYDTTGQTDLNHKNANNTDCVTCHPHDMAFASSCGSCHGYPPDSTVVGAGGLAKPATSAITYSGNKGAHVVHTNTLTFNMKCETCHGGYTTNPMGNSKIEMGFAVNGTNYPGFTGTVPVTTGTFTGNNTLTNGYQWYTTSQHGTTINRVANTATCSIYCHGSTLSGGSASTPSWVGTSQATCTSTCHGMTAASPPTTGSHTIHASNSGTNLAMSCDKCHGAHTDNTHVNGTVKWDLTTLTGQYKTPTGSYATSGNTGKLAPSASFGQCTNLYCHSTVQGTLGTGSATYAQPTWGTSSSVVCDSCHWGDKAPFKIMSTGSHRKHIVAYSYLCSDCHSGAGDNTAKHADGNIDVIFASGGTYGQTGAPGNGFSTCSNTVCHAGAAAVPTWGGAPMPADCTGCHGNEVNAATKLTGAHDKHLNYASVGGSFKCNACHAPTITNADNRTITNKVLHANGMVNYSGLMAGKTKTCANFYCHSNGKGTSTNPPTWISGTALGCDGCHGVGTGTGMPNNSTPNSHAKHAPTAADCYKCHFKTASQTAGQLVAGTVDHLDRNIDARLTKVSSFTSYSGAYQSNKTCSATYCHGGSVTTPAWGTANSTTCNSCHKSKPVIGGNLGLQGAHSFHIMSSSSNYNYTLAAANTSTSNAYNYTCASCHGSTVSNHTDGPRANGSDATILFGYSSAGRGATATNTYTTRTGTAATDSQGFKWMYGGNGNCNNTYCHSNGRGSNGNLATINWGSSATANCDSCHGNATTSLTLSPLHYKHVNNATLGGGFACIDCHATTVSSNLAIGNKTKHVNKFVDYSGLYAGRNKTCANFYCHSNGKGTPVNPPTWNSSTTLDCSGCHGSTAANLTTGNHAAHITAGATCQNCHWNTTQANGTIATVAQHINRTVGVNQGSTYKLVNVSFTGTTSCSAISCHSNGTNGTLTPATWGSTLKCDGCHPNLSAAHTVHANLNLNTGVTFYNYTAIKSTGSEVTEGGVKYRFGCATCHPLVESTYHIDGSVEVQLDPATAGASTLRQKNGVGAIMNGDKSCDLVYCHSDGKNAMVVGPTGNGHAPFWTTTFATLGGDRCAKCHGNSPQTAAHNAHQVGIHYDNVFNGTSGKLAAAATGSSSHGVAGQSTTITCNTCHYKTMMVSKNDQNTLCNTCHTKGVNGALVKGNAEIADFSFHVNGKKEIAFPTTALKVISKAQIRTGSFSSYSGVWVRNGGNYKTGTTAFDTAKVALSDSNYNAGTVTCSNISCHNLRVGQSVVWTDTTISCQSCHNSL